MADKAVAVQARSLAGSAMATLQIRHCEQVLPVLCEGTDQYLQVRRQVMRHRDASQMKGMLGKEDGTSKDGLHWLGSGENTAPKLKKAPDRDEELRLKERRVGFSKWRAVTIEEEDDVDKHCPVMITKSVWSWIYTERTRQ